MRSPFGNFLYIVGIIDFLQLFTIKKQGERFGKNIFSFVKRTNTDFSCKPPKEYATRFRKKVKKVFRKAQIEEYDVALQEELHMRPLSSEKRNPF